MVMKEVLVHLFIFNTGLCDNFHNRTLELSLRKVIEGSEKLGTILVVLRACAK